MTGPTSRGLEARLGRDVQGDVRFDSLSRGLYSTDASIFQIQPLGVVLPTTDDDVAAVLGAATDHGVSVTPRGAGTSQGGQTVGDGLVVDVSRHMNRILQVDPDARTAVVQPGVVLDDLNRVLAEHGLFFPVDVATASRATLGGMAANNSSGARSIRYGIMADHVKTIDALLADGTPVRVGSRGAGPGPRRAKGAADPRLTTDDGSGGGQRLADIRSKMSGLATREAGELARRIPAVLRHVAGYNLHRVSGDGSGLADLLVGSEGTLAFFTRLELALTPLPSHRALGVCHFPTLHGALDAVQHIVTLDPSAVELTDGTLIGLARRNPEFRVRVERFTRGDPAALLFVEFSGPTRDELDRKLRDLDETMSELAGAGEVVPVVESDAQGDVWAVRRAGLNIVMSGRDPRRPVSIIEDCAIPLDRLAEWGDRLTQVFDRHGVAGTWYAHASVGCLHVRPSLDLKDAADVVRMREIAEEALEIVSDLGGSHSGEHGDGLIRSEFIEPMLGSRLARAFEEVKDAFDPGQVLNPGKVVRAGPMDDRKLFRYHPDYRPLPVVEALDWSDEGGLLSAVERCNNNGACRKREPGVMCPSFRATGEERDVTRGRANALRLALTGQLGSAALASEELVDVLDLCVGCKACRRECPTGVDVSRMKIEVLSHVRASGTLPLRERVFAFLPRLAPRLSRMGWLANAGAAVLPARLKEAGGLAGSRPLPRWSRRPFRDGEIGGGVGGLRGQRGAAPGGADGDRTWVALFADTFNRWFEPENVRAAQRVLEAAGVSVVGPADAGRPLCCGRTFLSAGLVDEARAELTRTARHLVPLIESGIPVVGLEPSCLLTFRDEAGMILPAEVADVLARGTFLLEEWLTRPGSGSESSPLDVLTQTLASAGEAGVVGPDAGTGGPTIHVHGHCHQKAFAVDGSVGDVLARIPGSTVESIPSGCCGMAGSFGYESEHADVSRSMAELDLLPAVRGIGDTDAIVADGFSCRHQIADLGGRSALHAARVLAAALGRGD